MRKKRTKRVTPPIGKQSAFELMFGYEVPEAKTAPKPLIYEGSRGRLNGQSI